MTPERSESLHDRVALPIARRKAREFVLHLQSERWAEPLPEEWDSMTDEQIKAAIEFLENDSRVRRRPDMKWEAI